MDKKKKILKMYYDESFKLVDIASKCNVTKQYVSKIIKSDDRYIKEKQDRKNKTKIKKKNYTNIKMKEIRDRKSQLEGYMKQLHLQATNELSGGRATINNRAYRKWNASAYKYSTKKKCYVLIKGINAGYSTPKYIR